jgi:hypothetical protein
MRPEGKSLTREFKLNINVEKEIGMFFLTILVLTF